jgi:hypothetical protein
MIFRLATVHEDSLSPLGERVARDGAFTSRRESGEGVRVRYFHGREECLPWPSLQNCRDSSLHSE